MPHSASRAVILVVAALLSCSREQAAPRADSGGKAARLRVVCLTPSSTELVAAVGATDTIVGVDRFSAYPPEVHSLPKVGDFLSPNLEAILSLHPDIVVADAVQTEVVAKLQTTGMTVLSLPMQTIDDVREALRSVGRALGREAEAERAIAALDGDLQSVREHAARAAARAGAPPRVLFVVDRQPGSLGGLVAAGPGSYLDELLRHAGAENVLADSPVRYANISVEEVIARRPDVILDAAHTDDAGRARADWNLLSSVPAVQTGRVHVLADTAAVSPGPRLGQVLARVTKLVWGD